MHYCSKASKSVQYFWAITYSSCGHKRSEMNNWLTYNYFFFRGTEPGKLSGINEWTKRRFEILKSSSALQKYFFSGISAAGICKLCAPTTDLYTLLQISPDLGCQFCMKFKEPCYSCFILVYMIYFAKNIIWSNAYCFTYVCGLGQMIFFAK
jgi:hypothetical protein